MAPRFAANLCSSIALVIPSTELEKGWLYLLVGHQGLGSAGEPVSSEAGENPGSPRCAALRNGISSWFGSRNEKLRAWVSAVLGRVFGLWLDSRLACTNKALASW